jgi:phosphatidate cytidylyltransferase
MLRNRLIVIIILTPTVVVLNALGGWTFTLAMSAIFGYAAWEFWRIFKNGGYSPSRFLLIAGTAGVIITRHVWGEQGSILTLSTFIMAAMAFHIFAYEHGEPKSASDFAITTTGIIYIGWFGSFFIALRNLPEGFWWLMVALPAVMFTDIGGFIFGSWLGKHHMSPLISPKKTWEGYFGGVFMSVVITASVSYLWGLASPAITFERGALVALVVALLSPLGDFGESMIKRQAGVKDSGKIFPGHGGMFDRVDTWFWTAIIGYYMVIFLWMH